MDVRKDAGADMLPGMHQTEHRIRNEDEKEMQRHRVHSEEGKKNWESLCIEAREFTKGQSMKSPKKPKGGGGV